MKEKQSIAESSPKVPLELPSSLALPALSVLITACNDLSPKGAHEATWGLGYATIALSAILITTGIFLLRRNGPRK